MVDGVTPKLGLVKPEVNASRNSWGDKTNANWDKVDDLLPSASYTAADVLAKIKTVDGAGSGLDADLLDGLNGTYYLDWNNFTNKPATFPPSTHTHTESEVTNLVTDLAARVLKAGDTMTGNLTISHPSAITTLELRGGATNGHTWIYLTKKAQTGQYNVVEGRTDVSGVGQVSRWQMQFGDSIAETTPYVGSNRGGSNFSLYCFDDAGTNALLSLWGSRATGLLSVIGDPTAALGIATKQYVDAKPAGATISDTPPPTPSPGQTWWESDSGNFYIWYNDGNTSQWVQVNGPSTGNNPPSDGGEYVMVNGVWRLKAMTYSPSGVASQVVIVPPTAKAARIYGHFFYAAAAAATMQLSGDGTTYATGATDYTLGGTNTFAGSTTSPAKQALVQSSAWTLHPNADNLNTGSIVNADLVVGKPVGAHCIMMWRGYGFLNAAANYLQEYQWTGYTNVASIANVATIGAFRISAGANFAAGTRIQVEWVY